MHIGQGIKQITNSKTNLLEKAKELNYDTLHQNLIVSLVPTTNRVVLHLYDALFKQTNTKYHTITQLNFGYI